MSPLVQSSGATRSYLGRARKRRKFAALFSGEPKASLEPAGSQAQAHLFEPWHHGAIEVLQFLIVVEKAKDDSLDSNRRDCRQLIDDLVGGAYDRTAAPVSSQIKCEYGPVRAN
jgi:hypothetical protein